MSPASRPLGLGLCGVGRTGYGRIRRELSKVPPNADGSPRFVLTAAYDLLSERARRLAEETGARAHGRFEDLLADPAVDVVVIATRSDAHAPLAEAALRAGKHVVVEKPMAVNLAEADRLIRAATELGSDPASGRVNGPQLLVRLSKRFDPTFRKAEQTLAAGELGKVHGVQLRVGEFVVRRDWQTLRRCGGGQLLNWGPHVIDWAVQLLGGTADVLWCELRRVAAAGDAEDHVKLLLRGPTDILADVEISGGNAAPQPMMVLQGDRGALTVYPDLAVLKQLKQPLDRRRLSADEGPPPLDDRSYRAVSADQWRVTETRFDPFDGEGRFWSAVFDRLTAGTPFPITLAQAREVMRVIDEARRLGQPDFEKREVAAAD
ncbi:MAG: Gfo/Idh/MocA family protein [Tepidisphaerales bacterium]